MGNVRPLNYSKYGISKKPFLGIVFLVSSIWRMERGA